MISTKARGERAEWAKKAATESSLSNKPIPMERDQSMPQLKTRIENIEKRCATSDPELEKDARALAMLNICVGLLDSSIDIEKTGRMCMENGFTLSRLFRDIAAIGRGLPTHKLGNETE
jgi:hypothetical protein